MNRVLKTLLLWLLIAALPIQGFAAAIKASCSSAHHNSLQSIVFKAHHHDSAALNHHSHHDDDSTSHVMASVTEPVLSTMVDDVTDEQDLRTNAYCSACAVCSVGASAPPLSLTWTPERPSSETVSLSTTTLFTGHIPAGLERPPKYFSV